MSNRAKPSQTHLLPGYKIARFQIFSNAKQPRMTSLVEDIVNLVDSPLKALLAHSDALQNDPINSKKKINRSVGQKISNPQTALKRGQLGFLDFFLGAFSVGIFAKGVQKCWSSGGEMWCAPWVLLFLEDATVACSANIVGSELNRATRKTRKSGHSFCSRAHLLKEEEPRKRHRRWHKTTGACVRIYLAGSLYRTCAQRLLVLRLSDWSPGRGRRPCDLWILCENRERAG